MVLYANDVMVLYANDVMVLDDCVLWSHSMLVQLVTESTNCCISSVRTPTEFSKSI